MSAHAARILPMKTAGTHHFIERTYRESGQFQWVREVLMNSIEAKATRVEFGIEWQAVENQGVYRRLIADDGCGMRAAELVEFFNTFGGGGKPIGGIHDNFGVGSKTSLLPWNQYGMVVVSWVDGDPSMIWVKRDPETGDYGLKLERCITASGIETLDAVYDPYDDQQHGCDWSLVKPEWITDHGTVIVLLGNSPSTDTVEGDPGRSEADIKGISSFLNRRFWKIPDGMDVYVDELRTSDRSSWPSSEPIAHGSPDKSGKDRRTNTRHIEGARFYITYPDARPGIHGKIEAQGTVDLRDGTKVSWYLWDGERPKVQSYAAISGYIAARYKNELYDIATHHSTYRSFGISESSVRTRLWLIVRPVVDHDDKRGVYPRTDRSSLLVKGGPNAGGPLPWNEWAAEFADNMPAELLQALTDSRKGDFGSINDESWRERLADRFGSRWRIPRFIAKSNGSTKLDPNAPPPRKSKRIDEPTEPRIRDAKKAPIHRVGKAGTLIAGEPVSVHGGIPTWRTVGAQDVGPGMLAAWDDRDPRYPEGVVLINVEHPVMVSVIDHWQSQYADHHAGDISKAVIETYGQVAVSKVAHSEHLKSILPSHVVEKSLRSEDALTMSLLGLMAEEHLISTRVGGKFSKKRAINQLRRSPK